MTTDINKLLERLRTYYGDDLACRMLLMDARHALEALAGEVASLQNTFDLMWKADQRAIKLWQETTGKDHIWPDRTKTTIWLLERAEAAEAERDRTRADYEAMKAHNKELFGKLSAAELERDRLKEAIERNAQNCIDTMNKMHAQHAAERDRLAGEVEALRERNVKMRAFLAETSTDAENRLRAERDRLAGEVDRLKKTITTAVQFNEGLAAERDRLKAALNEIAGFADDRPGDWAAMHARKALGDAS